MDVDGMVVVVIHALSSYRNDVKALLGPVCNDFVEVESATAALDSPLLEKADLVLVELSDSAIELCKSIRKSNRNQLLPVWALSSGKEPDKEVLILEAGADAILPQTVHASGLRAAVQSSLRRKAAIAAVDQTETVLFTLAQSVEERDPALAQHCGRLAFMAAGMGISLGLDAAQILALQRGGYLHDIGKVAIPDSVLFKPGALTEEEWMLMKSHTIRGERICRNVRSLAPILPIIRSHHERWDGTGYPDGLKGDEIPLLARIIQVVDVYDALTTERTYKRAFTPEAAVEILKEETRRGWRDPRLTRTFIDLLPLLTAPERTEFCGVGLQSLASSMGQYRPRGAGLEIPQLLAGRL